MHLYKEQQNSKGENSCKDRYLEEPAGESRGGKKTFEA